MQSGTTDSRWRNQRGATLLFALLALVIMGLASVAISRSVDTGLLIMGNLGFKQETLLASNAGAEGAIDWLSTNSGTVELEADRSARGYYATSRDDLDMTGNKTTAARPMAVVNWDGTCQGIPAGNRLDCDVVPFTSPTTVNGNTVQWVITRLCSSPGPDAAPNVCARPVTASTTATGERGELGPGGRVSPPSPSPLFRVVVRVTGARNTVSYTETLVSF